MSRVSIIVTCFNNTHTAAHMSMLCLDHIRKFTDPLYELIVMDPAPKFPIRDDYKTLNLHGKDSYWFQLPEDPGYTACMNKGASMAGGEVLVFMQNDVFVREGWLKDLLWYIENGYDAVFPDQVPRTREYILETYKRGYNHPESKKGGRDAGLIMIKKSVFEKMGRWNEKLGLLAERDFFERLANFNWTDTNKVLITHIMAATNLDRLDTDPDEYNLRMKKDADLLNK